MTTATINAGLERVLRPLGARLDAAGVVLLATNQAIGWRSPPEGADLSHAGIGLAIAAVVAAAGHAFERANIERDENLSPSGKARRAREIDIKRLHFVNTECGKATAFAESTEKTHAARLGPAGIEPGDAAGALADREIRDFLRGLELGPAIRLAQTDEAVAAAVLRSPSRALLPAEVFEAAERLRAAEIGRDPQAEAIRLGLAIAVFARQVAEQALHAATGISTLNRFETEQALRGEPFDEPTIRRAA